jgi:hypothetical protein
MPNLELIPVPIFQPMTPYHHLADQIPIDALVTRINMVNGQVENDSQILRDSIGSAGTLSNRLNKSLEDDGSIKSVAIDNALHKISEHLDSDGFVRMTTGERSKLSLIDSGATNFGLSFTTISGILGFDYGNLNIKGSDTVTWRYQGGYMYADNAFPASVRHTHYYGINPVPVNLMSPDYKNYKTTSISTPYQTGSLRVYLNGIRLSQNASVDVPIYNGTDYVPTTYSFTEGVDDDGIVTDGTFVLSDAITLSDVLVIDFDVLYS